MQYRETVTFGVYFVGICALAMMGAHGAWKHDEVVDLPDPVALVNNWSIRHPYLAVGALLCISANPEILMTPLQLTGKIISYTCNLPSQVMMWPLKVSGRFLLYILGFRRHDVVIRDSFASRHQSSRYVGYAKWISSFEEEQPPPAPDPRDRLLPGFFVSLWSGMRAVRILARMWGWGNLLKCAGALGFLCMLYWGELD